MTIRQKISSLVTISLVGGLVGLSSSPAQAVAPVGANFVVTAADLHFISDQIRISEAHATRLTSATTKYTVNDQPIVTAWDTPLVPNSTSVFDIPNPDLPWGLRQVDGRNNNLETGRGEWGASDTPFPRLTAARWREIQNIPSNDFGATPTNGSYKPVAGVTAIDAAPRLISNLIVDQSECNPAAMRAANSQVTFAPCGAAATIIGASATSESLTFETKLPHGLSVGTKVSISNVGSGYNVDGVVTSVVANYVAPIDPLPGKYTYQFSIANPDSPTVPDAIPASTGSVVAIAVPNPVASASPALVDLGADVTRFKTDQKMTNVSPNGNTSPTSGIFTIFGQFFDHGLDHVGKSSTDLVYMPLNSDDPLYSSGSPTNFMAMARTILGNGQVESPGMEPAGDNSTTPYIDQNQTYTSHPSHQVFLREYTFIGGLPKPTGDFLDGNNGTASDPAKGGLATWSDIKTQSATKLGIELVDTDVFDVPLLLTNEFGAFLPGRNGLPMVAVKAKNAGDAPLVATGSFGFLEGSLTAAITTDGTLSVPIYGKDAVTGNEVIVVPAGKPYTAIRTGHAFLDDINHCAVPGSSSRSTGDCTSILDFNTTPAGSFYSASLLGSHFVTGDGRGNENIALTAIHSAFHSEHNRLIDDKTLGYKQVIVDEANTMTGAAKRTYMSDWVNETIAANVTPCFDALTLEPYRVPGANGNCASLLNRTDLTWNGEHLFQAARFVMEMQYQHIVFAEFVRTVEPAIAAFAGYDINVRGDVYAEFAHSVYRYGHSQLTDTVDRIDSNGNAYPDSLFNSFLSPEKFNTGLNDAPISATSATGDVFRGMSGQRSNEIDEFVSSDLRNSLLGIPLDLASINIARGRDAGIGSLNQIRRDLKLTPYDNWYDYGLALRNPESLVNFIAAYATADTTLGASVTSETTVNGKRAAAYNILELAHAGDPDATNFMFGSVGTATTGVENIDLWVGGLAESPGVCLAAACPLLGETLATIFRRQMEDLQAGDRMYYLSRLVGTNLLVQVESNTLAELFMRNSDAENLPALIMQTADYSVAATTEASGCPSVVTRDLVSNSVVTGIVQMISALDCRLQYVGPARKDVVYGGGSGNDNIRAGNGDDTVRGNDGNDYVNGGDGNNQLFGGHGNDVLIDAGNSSSIGVLNGGDGNDVLAPGNGAKGSNAGSGDDVVIAGVAPAAGLLGLGDDKFLGSETGDDAGTGDDGSDWLEGHGGLDALIGDAGAVFGVDTVKFATDYLWGGSANDSLDGGGASDILGEGDGGAGSDTLLGGFGWDWVTAQGSIAGASYDGLCGNAVPLSPVGTPGVVQCPAGFVETFLDAIEGMVGSSFDDYMRGDDSLTYAVTPGIANSSNELIGSDFYKLSETGTRVPNGLGTVLGINPADNATEVVRTGNIMLAGPGSDELMGGGGNDCIFGDGTQTVELRVKVPAANGGGFAYVQSMNDLVGTPAKSVRAMLLDQSLDPKDLVPVTSYSRGTPAVGEVDTAVYSLSFADYTFSKNADGSVTVTQVTPAAGGGVKSDDSDRLFGIEQIKFLNSANTLIPTTVSIANGFVPSAPNAVAAVSASTSTALVTWTAPTYPNAVFAGPITSYTVAATSQAPGASLTLTGNTTGNGTRIRYNVSNPAGANQIVTGDIVTITGFVNGELNLTNAVVSASNTARVDILSTSTATEAAPAGAQIVKARVANTANATALSATLTGLTQGVAYNVAVRANTTVALAPIGGEFSTNVSVTPSAVPPSQPLNVLAVNAGPTSALISWNAPSVIGDASVLQYRVNLKDVTAFPNVDLLDVCAATNTARTCSATGLTKDHTYQVTVTAINASFEGSATTPITVVPTDLPNPTQPRNLVLTTAGSGQITAEWTAPLYDGNGATPNRLSYVVTATSPGQTTRTCTVAAAGAPTCLVTGLVNGSTYTMSVVATNNLAASSPALTGTIIPTNATSPGQPTAAQIGVPTGTTLPVSWTAPAVNGSSRLRGYLVRAYTSASGGTPAATCSAIAPTTTCDLTGLNYGTAYWVAVLAQNATLTSTEVTLRTVTKFTTGSSVATSTISSSASTLIANGTSTSTISVQMKNSAGTNLSTSGGTVLLSKSGTGNGVLSAAVEGANGIWTATYTTAAGGPVTPVVISGTFEGVAITSTATIALNSQVASTSRSNLQLDLSTLEANGASTSQVTVTLLDADGIAIGGAGTKPSFTVTAGGGTISGASIASQGSGVWTATYTSPTSGAAATPLITAYVSGVALTTTRNMTLTPQAVSLSNSTVNACTSETPCIGSALELESDGASSRTIQVQLKDSNNSPLIWNGGNSALSIAAAPGVITNLHYVSGGMWAATYTSPLDQVGDTQVVASYNSASITSEVTVTLIPRVMSMANALIVAGNSATVSAEYDIDVSATIPVRIWLRNSNDVSLGRDMHSKVAFRSHSGSFTGIQYHSWTDTVVDGNTIVGDYYSAEYTPSVKVVGIISLGAKYDGTDLPEAAEVKVVGSNLVDVDKSVISVSDATLEAIGSNFTTVTLQLKNSNNEPLTPSDACASFGVAFESNFPTSAISEKTCDSGTGIWSAKFTPTDDSSGTAIISAELSDAATLATFSNLTMSETATLNVIGKQANLDESTLTNLGASELLGDGTSQTTLSLQLRDSLGNRLLKSGGTVEFQTTLGTVSAAVYDEANDVWLATYTAPSNIAGNSVISALINSAEIASTVTLKISAIQPVSQLGLSAPAVASKNKYYSVKVTFPAKFKSAKTTITIRKVSGTKVASSSSTQTKKSKATVKVKIPKKLASGTYVVTVTVKVGKTTYTSSQQTIRVK